MKVVANVKAVIILQYISVLNQHTLTYTLLYVYHISIKLEYKKE